MTMNNSEKDGQEGT